MDWSGVDYCDVFISCLDSHSDGTHSLQSIHCWASDGMLHFSKSDEETNSSTSWMIWGRGHFQLIFILGWSISISEMLCWHSRARSETLVPLLEGWWRCYSLQSRLIHSRCNFLPTQETLTLNRIKVIFIYLQRFRFSCMTVRVNLNSTLTSGFSLRYILLEMLLIVAIH